MPMKRWRRQKKVASKNEKAARKDGVLHFKNSRKWIVIHCKQCGGANHNKKTCPLYEQPTGGASEPRSIPANPIEGTCNTPAARSHTQPSSTIRKSKKSKR
ncbi:hypothetical protein LIER_14324 [Lithospermum erythrorhizon]|uniref:Zinc knuckle CX2CX4HX4C domain-containing protein n=1 Tax=Lithospermum erythrorhizon TaxID=34254 RepID=A0AAV3Q110_LITER